MQITALDDIRISIHAPIMGSNKWFGRWGFQREISIHAPTAGSALLAAMVES